MTMELFYAALSDVGNVRTNNEDYLFAGKLKEDEYLFIVADGMGGHQAGEVASRKAVSVFSREVEKGLGPDTNESLKRIMLEVNDILLAEGQLHEEKNGMGTTLSVLYIKNGTGYCVHVGDSRIYRFNHSDGLPVLHQITEDHSFVGKLLKDGYITEEEARSHPRRNVLYQSIGLKSDITVQVLSPFHIPQGEKFLLCSDGLYGVVTDADLKDALADNSLSRITKKLVKKAKSNGGPDNITVIVVSTEPDNSIDDDTAPQDTATLIIPPMLPAKKKRSPWFFILLLFLLLILLGVILFILLTSASQKTGSSHISSHVSKPVSSASATPSSPLSNSSDSSANASGSGLNTPSSTPPDASSTPLFSITPTETPKTKPTPKKKKGVQ